MLDLNPIAVMNEMENKVMLWKYELWLVARSFYILSHTRRQQFQVFLNTTQISAKFMKSQQSKFTKISENTPPPSQTENKITFYKIEK